MKQQKDQFNPVKASNTWKKVSWIAMIPIMICFILMPILIFTGHGEWSFLVFWIAFGFTVVFIVISWIFRFKMAIKMKDATPPANPASTPDHTMATYQNQERKSLREQQNDYLARQEKYHDADEHRNAEKPMETIVCRRCGYINQPNASFCSQCGEKLDPTKH
ncbi:zinc-ribbon domain-containing protein [bacterium]|nr:zinc-ribbon domain-containing protein [bacterium]MDY5298623.1 zinc-ribbon domain-containing protein [Candidatus Enteromonas sp.]